MVKLFIILGTGLELKNAAYSWILYLVEVFGWFLLELPQFNRNESQRLY